MSEKIKAILEYKGQRRDVEGDALFIIAMNNEEERINCCSNLIGQMDSEGFCGSAYTGISSVVEQACAGNKQQERYMLQKIWLYLSDRINELLKEEKENTPNE